MAQAKRYVVDSSGNQVIAGTGNDVFVYVEQDNQSAYLEGGGAATSSQSAFVKGAEPTSSTSAYLTGIERNSTSAFTKGGLPWFSKYKLITIDHNEVPSTLTDFPFTLKIRSDNDLRTVANGGYVQNTALGGKTGGYTVPADLVFAEDAFNNSVLDHEIEYYNPTTGELWAHIRIPSLSGSVDTKIYMTFGNASITNSQENVGRVWLDDYIVVLHLDESSGVRYDSTINGHNANPVNTPGRYDGTGVMPLPIKYGLEVDGSTEGVQIPFHADFLQDEWAVEVWAKSDITNYSSPGTLVRFGDYTGDGWSIHCAAYDQIEGIFNGHTKATGYSIDSADPHVYGIDLNTTANTFKLYRDRASWTYSSPGSTEEEHTVVSIGMGSKSAQHYWDGWIDEVRISSKPRSDDYYETIHRMLGDYYQYTNFLTIGSLQDVVFRGDTPAFLEGYADGESTTPAYLAGHATAKDSTPAFLASGGTTTSSQAAFLQGPAPTISSTHAYLTGPHPATDSQAAYMEGNPPPQTSSVSAWLWADWSGVPPTVRSSINGYLEGDGVWPFSDNYTGSDGDSWNNLKWEADYGI